MSSKQCHRKLVGKRPPRLSVSTASLPFYSATSSAIEEKLVHMSHATPPYWTPVVFPVRTRRLHIVAPNLKYLYRCSRAWLGGMRRSMVYVVVLLVAAVTVFVFVERFGGHLKRWPSSGRPSTLVYRRQDLQRIWKWEISSGHYPSRKSLPEKLQMGASVMNPALPPQVASAALHDGAGTAMQGTGARRIYVDFNSEPRNFGYPSRPLSGSIADLDVVMEHCDFSQKKFVRDCLEVLRVGAGLDNGRLRRGKLDNWKYIYVEQPFNSSRTARSFGEEAEEGDKLKSRTSAPKKLEHGLVTKRDTELEETPISLPPLRVHIPHAQLETPCDPDNPHLFHMFWTGAFTDKPYLAILSFLYTQNTGLHLSPTERALSADACRPQLWLWINPGPAAEVSNESSAEEMFEALRENPWSSPLLHPRFRDVVTFKLWNTTEQLDGVEEVREEWRTKNIFNSGGEAYAVPLSGAAATGRGVMGWSTFFTRRRKDGDLLRRKGSKSSSSYDRMSVILSDMARFVLCHRFGGIYLDTDTILLRDWEELWGWKGAFAYRWSRLETYNTAVLRMNKGSALGRFLFRTALKNKLDFHPMTVALYAKDALVEGLLLRLPDALFDAAWLNVEAYQRTRPPQPYFTSFEQFFASSSVDGGAPGALGFDGFFKGAFSYHFHNSWWKPFDVARNWPDLGPRFKEGEERARTMLVETAMGGHVNKVQWKGKGKEQKKAEEKREEGRVQEQMMNKDQVEEAMDVRDLEWSMVMKRTFEAYIRGERPNMYGEWLVW